MLGNLAYSMLLGSRGNQRKEVRKVCRWLSLARPDVLIFSNILIGGCIEEIKQELDSVEEKIRSSEDYYTEKKQYFDELMRNATNTLTRKIRKFE